VGGAIVGGIIGVAMGHDPGGWSQQERNKPPDRVCSARRAAIGVLVLVGQDREEQARYVNKGQVASSDGKKCSRVQETITLPDGKQGTSEETVCFS
jgi:hypothetical protein